MITQLLKLIWNQRKYNKLLFIEIVLSFIVLFVMSAVCIHFWKRYNEPIGYEIKNRWILQAYQAHDTPPDQVLSDSVKIIRNDEIKNFIRQNYPEVISLAKANGTDYPYSYWGSSSCNSVKKKQICFEETWPEPDLIKVFDIKLTEGRWLTDEDLLSNIRTVVINQKLKKEIFGNAPAAGKTFTVDDDQKPIKIKVVGVVDHMKKNGDFKEEPFFMYNSPMGKKRLYHHFALHLPDNIPQNFEPGLIKELSNRFKTYEFKLESLEKSRQKYILTEISPIVIVFSIAIFLIVNVMLGLFGTLWLNISRRKSEIGLRRAVGSTSTSILWQILGETYGLAIASLLIGLIFTCQIFLFNIYNTPVSTLIMANLVSSGIILLLCTLSAYAPAKQAAKMEPAMALHEE